MSTRDTKVKRTLFESGLKLLAKEYEKNPSYGHTGTAGHGALGSKNNSVFIFASFVASRDHFFV